MPQNYNDTIHKMATPFEMRAGLPKKEPKMLEDWEKNHVYEKMIEHNADLPRFVLHDGPPYANGNIHMGTALNKIIKDIIIREKNMSGYCAPYVPGYDTHGLPIELKALSSLGDKKAGISKLELRKICKEFATEHIDVMNSQFARLGVQGDFANPYLTLRPEFEARQVEIFGEMAKKGYIYKGMKAVYWCPEDRTALAEAEIEYAEDECDSIYVRFKLTDDPNGVLAKYGIPLDKAWIVIWTTTTWTLPANVATCLNPSLEYAFVKIGDEYHLMAAGLVESTMKACHIEDYEVLEPRVLGAEFELMQYQHPFLDRKGLVILGDHVTLEGGTGCVHTAPGHGVEDFEVCVNHYPQVPIIVPVDDGGYLTEEAGKEFAGLKVWAANKVILEHIKQSGHLMGVQHITHQYPHCWRCKNPVLFRATDQWFVSMDKTGLREQGDQDKARVWGQFMNGDGFAPVFGKDKRGEGCHARRKIETDTEPESYENKPRLTERVHQRHQQKDTPGDGQWDGRDLPWFEAREEKTGSGQCRTEPGALHQEEARRLRVPDSQIFLNGDKQRRQRGARHVVQEKQQRNKSRPRQGCPERHGNIFRGHETLLTVISCTIAASSLKGQTADGGPGEEAP